MVYSFSGIDDNDPIVAVVIKHQQFLTIWIYDYKSRLLKSKNETIVLKYLYDDLQIKFSSKNKKLVILIGSSYLINDITLDITQINQIDNYKKFCFLVKAKDVLILIQQNGLLEFKDQTSKFNFKSSNLMISNIDKNKDFEWYYHQSRQVIILQNGQKLFLISMKSSLKYHYFRRILHTKHDQYFIDQFTMTEQSELFVYVSKKFKNVNILLHCLQAKKLIRNFSLLWNQQLINEKTQILCSSQSSTLIFMQKYDVYIINLKTGKVILFLKSDMKNRNYTQPIKIFDGLIFVAQNKTIKVWKLPMNEKHKND